MIDIIRKVCLAIAAWDTAVAIFNTTIVLRSYPEAAQFITPTSQFLPVIILLSCWALCHPGVRKILCPTTK